MAESKTVSFLGLGVMGSPMAHHLLDKGFEVVLWNRTADKAKKFELFKKAQFASSSKEALQKSDVSILMLWDAKSVHHVIDELDTADFKTPTGEPKTFIGTITISPEDSKHLSEVIHNKGGKWIEAPVLGNVYAATAGQLKIFVGTNDKEIDPKIIKILSSFGSPVHVGGIGDAANTKLAFNYFLASTFANFSTIFGWLERTGNAKIFLSLLDDGKFTLAPYFKSWSEKFSKRQYDPFTFAAAGIDKDVTFAYEQIKKSGVNTQAIEGTHNLIHGAVTSLDIAEKDWSTIYEYVNPKQ
jgi:3-hydroxyisobutyrate dehydrogenase-like beta-hydroxyacid dehydrogenase